MVVNSNYSNSILTVGSNITLSCTVKLSAVVDIPVTVGTEWTGPNNTTLTATGQTSHVPQLNVGSTTSFTATATVTSFGRENSGNYTCIATVTHNENENGENIGDSGITAVNTSLITTGMNSK